MIVDETLFSDPPSYPKSGTYSDLLFWHLEIWGTGNGGDMSRAGDRWHPRDFLGKIILKNFDFDSDRANLENWLGRKGPPSRPTDRNIENALFGPPPAFQRWRLDLREAHSRSRGKDKDGQYKNRRTVDFSLTIKKNNPVEINSNFAAAAQENVELVVERLTDFFVGRADDLQEIDEFVSARMAGGRDGLLVITAPPGFGKSAFAAHWCAKAGQSINRRIAYHFCSVTTGRATTSPENVYANLHRQIADIMGEPVRQSNSRDALTSLLRIDAPKNFELVLWLDGIDEAEGMVECFLPRQLGERICIIISARADRGEIPSYLKPWLDDYGMAERYKPLRKHLEKLTLADVGRLADALFAKAQVARSIDLDHLAKLIFKNSEQGHTLFVRAMVEDEIKAAKDGKNTNFRTPLVSLEGYAEREVERLEGLDGWAEYSKIFTFLTIAREAVPIDTIPIFTGINSKRIYPNSFPYTLRRWLSITRPTESQSALISLAHPLLAKIFEKALKVEKEDALRYICDSMLARPRGEWPTYALRHLPCHLFEASQYDVSYGDKGMKLLMEGDFQEVRFAALVREDIGLIMFEDWMKWLRVDKSGLSKDYFSAPMYHFHHWRNTQWYF